jgi:hypothetical protein
MRVLEADMSFGDEEGQSEVAGSDRRSSEDAESACARDSADHLVWPVRIVVLSGIAIMAQYLLVVDAARHAALALTNDAFYLDVWETVAVGAFGFFGFAAGLGIAKRRTLGVKCAFWANVPFLVILLVGLFYPVRPLLQGSFWDMVTVLLLILWMTPVVCVLVIARKYPDVFT